MTVESPSGVRRTPPRTLNAYFGESVIVRYSPSGVPQSPRRTHFQFESFRKMESARNRAESEADLKVRRSPRRTFLKVRGGLQFGGVRESPPRTPESPLIFWRVRSDSGGFRSDSGGLKILMILCQIFLQRKAVGPIPFRNAVLKRFVLHTNLLS